MLNKINKISDYLIQVSLIIISILIAFGVDRCGQQQRDDRELQSYYASIKEELTDEIGSLERNLNDCEHDVNDLTNALRLIPQEDSLRHGLVGLIRTVGRGVFRTFPPTVYDMMSQSKAILLIEDLELRQSLSSYSSFRDAYTKRDLIRHDEMTLEVIGELSEYIDLACILRNNGMIYDECLIDESGLQSAIGPIITPFLRHAQLREFHLYNALEITQETLDYISAD